MLSLFDALYYRYPRSVSAVLLASLGFALATWITWPLLPQFERALPSGDSPWGTVPMLNSWILWWNAAQLRYGFEQYWHAPIFAPEYGTLAFSEPQPATMLAAPVVWLISIPAGYNAYLFFSVTMNLAAGYWFLRNCRCSFLPSLAGGIAIALHPLAIDNIEAIQLLPMWGILIFLRGFIGIWQSPSLKHGLMLSLGFIGTTLSCIHHALFLAILVPVLILALVFYDRWPTRREQAINKRYRKSIFWGSLGVILISLAIGPMLYKMHQIHQQYDFERDIERVQVLSASLDSWTASQTLRVSLSDGSSFHLLPGWIRTCLAGLGLLICSRRSRPAVIMLAALVTSSFLLSFGANIGWSSAAENSLWNLACEWFSPLSRVRSPYRFAYFTQLGIILLAAIASNQILLAARLRWWEMRRRGEQVLQIRQLGRHALGLFLVVAVAVEILPPQCYLTQPPLAEFTPDWAYFLRTQSNAEDRVLCLPVAKDAAEISHEISTKWMLYGAQHSCVILNGYSGFTPKPWIDLRKQLRQKKWPQSTFDRLRAIETKFIVVRRDLTKVDLAQYFEQVERIFQDERYEVWRLIAKDDIAKND